MSRLKILRVFIFVWPFFAFSNLLTTTTAHANFEVSPHIGLHSRNAVYINGNKRASKLTLIFGGDVQYNFLLHRRTFYNTYMGLGLRYQYYFSQFEKSPASGQISAQRVGLLLSSRYLLRKRFIIGILYGLDL